MLKELAEIYDLAGDFGLAHVFALTAIAVAVVTGRVFVVGVARLARCSVGDAASALATVLNALPGFRRRRGGGPHP
jgi:hypothetical protein